jgi:hypothetical protein
MPRGWLIAEYEFREMWEEQEVIYFKVPSQHLLVGLRGTSIMGDGLSAEIRTWDFTVSMP